MKWTYQVITGDEAETQVLVLARDVDASLELIVRLQASSTFPSDSIENMVVACFHGLPVEDSMHTFPDRKTMRQHLYPAIDAAWAHFSMLESTEDGIRSQCGLYPDSVFNLEGSWSPELKRHLPQGRLVREIVLFTHFTSRFPRLPEVIQDGYRTDICGCATVPFIDVRVVTKLEPLGGRGTSTKITVQLNDSSITAVMKGLSFFDYLAHSDDSGNIDGRYKAELHAMNKEIKLLTSVFRQSHQSPYIMQEPIAFCTFDDVTVGTELPRICAAIYPFYEAGTLLDAVQQNNAALTRIPLYSLARWCYQLTSALYYAHITCHTYHMDLKIDNILLDLANNSIIIIDWEQSGANPFSLAPEAAQELDVVLNSKTGLLEFMPFQGSDRERETKRQNNPLAAPEWDVFPGWSRDCSLAAELAEVYSLGCTIWQLLKHHEFNDEELEWRLEENDERWVGVEGVIPESWRETVDKCIQADPNKRMRLRELMGFWEKEAR
ncbi:kinase-like domain-containing protein [Tirmania nivea]|nr:kinase-like domain-containing protein [Tirmania nivea]